MAEQTALTTTNLQAGIMERVLVGGDLGALQPPERLAYYRAVCESVGLNPLTKPFDYIKLGGRLVLYARKDATDQLRKIHRVSITKLERADMNGVHVVTAYATDGDGRQDVATGAVNLVNLKGDALANALMKAETKAKRRVTLSICGMGWLDETEVSTIPEAAHVVVDEETGEIIDKQPVSGNGQGATGNGNGDDIPRKPDDLLAFVNAQVQIPYDNLPHLSNALKKCLGDGWGWPAFRDTDGWQAALTAAMEYAEAKLAEAS